MRGVGTEGRCTKAFILLLKLFTLRLTSTQLGLLVNHADSVYIRGLGFLYIRFVVAPDQLWDWCVRQHLSAPYCAMEDGSTVCVCASALQHAPVMQRACAVSPVHKLTKARKGTKRHRV